MGGDGMAKKIVCKVIRSIPLSENGLASWQRKARGTSQEHQGTGEIFAENLRDEYNGDFTSYISRSGKPAVSVETNPTGRILDCYV